MQVFFRLRDGVVQGGWRLLGDAWRRGRFEAALRLLHGGRGGADGGFGFAADLGHAFGAGARCIEGAFACVEGEVEGLAIVALRDHLARFFERGDGGAIFLGRVTVGARGARGLDCALGLVHFAGGWSGAGRRDDGRREEPERGTPKTRHL